MPHSKTHKLTDGGGGQKLETFHAPIYIYTAFFGLIFFIGPFLVKNSPDKGIIRCCIMLAAFSMWLFWVTMYISQMNPLMGPRVSNHTMIWISHHWGEPLVKKLYEPLNDEEE